MYIVNEYWHPVRVLIRFIRLERCFGSDTSVIGVLCSESCSRYLWHSDFTTFTPAYAYRGALRGCINYLPAVGYPKHYLG